ncbi:MAG: S46 family peptidase [Tannerella sp.]|jgi:hypothetical protein|nr:S46 family peptidase [Tannerella sp.]
MNVTKKIWIAAILWIGACSLWADEGMWILKELNGRNLARMKELGFEASFEQLYSDSTPCVANAAVIFGGGCTGITVSEEGLIFTNHHCGFGAIQQLSSVDHDYLTDGFVSQSMSEELPVPDLTVRYLKATVDVSDRILPALAGIEDEYVRVGIADSISRVICDSVDTNEFLTAEVVPFYGDNQYYLIVYEVFCDVRLVFAPPGAVGKFGGDTDNWMWPRHTGDFSVFRVYAGADNQPAEYHSDNRPYRPRYVAEISLRGYEDRDFAMTLGFPGSTERHLCSWGVEQRIEHVNKPRIEVRGVKQAIWKSAMQAAADVRIKYATKYAGSSNYWKNSIGMNRGLANLDVMERKKSGEAAFDAWVGQSPERKAKYGHALTLLENGYTFTHEYRNCLTYLVEAFAGGTEIVSLAHMFGSVDVKDSDRASIEAQLTDRFQPFFKDYVPAVDQNVLAAMLEVVRERVPDEYLPDIYRKIDKKYKGNCARYAADVFGKTALLTCDRVAALLRDPVAYRKTLRKDPAMELYFSVMAVIYDLQFKLRVYTPDIAKGRRLYLNALREMYPDQDFYPDANFTMRLSYGAVGGYRPYDAAWYESYSTEQGVLEKADPASDEFRVPPDILALLRQKDFAPYANPAGNLQVCFLTGNDITGGNSGSPIFDGQTRLIGLAFDGNWEAMSGDIAFEPALQRCIGVDIRYVLFLIDKWGKCPRLIRELKLVR